jgi:hypothetical protein
MAVLSQAIRQMRQGESYAVYFGWKGFSYNTNVLPEKPMVAANALDLHVRLLRLILPKGIPQPDVGLPGV